MPHKPGARLEAYCASSCAWSALPRLPSRSEARGTLEDEYAGARRQLTTSHRRRFLSGDSIACGFITSVKGRCVQLERVEHRSRAWVLVGHLLSLRQRRRSSDDDRYRTGGRASE